MSRSSLDCMVQGLGLGVQGLRAAGMAWTAWFRDQGLGSRVYVLLVWLGLPGGTQGAPYGP